jgi:hypothetical protein
MGYKQSLLDNDFNLLFVPHRSRNRFIDDRLSHIRSRIAVRCHSRATANSPSPTVYPVRCDNGNEKPLDTVSFSAVGLDGKKLLN